MPHLGRVFLLAALCLVLAACGWFRRGDAPPTTQRPVTEYKRGDWFCQINEAGTDWDCVQDARLAENPIPTRLPRPRETTQETNADALDADLADATFADVDVAPANAANFDAPPPPPERPPEAPPLPPEEPGTAPPPPPEEPPAPTSTTAQQASIADWQRLAYQPEEATMLSTLPADFFAVQLVAVSTKEALEAFVIERRLSNMSAARIENEDEFLYVLLLGIYKTLADAQAAVASRPASLQDLDPWIRELGSLQGAMLRADEISGSANY